MSGLRLRLIKLNPRDQHASDMAIFNVPTLHTVSTPVFFALQRDGATYSQHDSKTQKRVAYKTQAPSQRLLVPTWRHLLYLQTEHNSWQRVSVAGTDTRLSASYAKPRNSKCYKMQFCFGASTTHTSVRLSAHTAPFSQQKRQAPTNFVDGSLPIAAICLQ